jgi:hypothetical protein
LGQEREITLANSASAGEYAHTALWIMQRLGHTCTFSAHTSLFSRRAHHSHFLATLSPRIAARWCACQAARARRRCLLATLLRVRFLHVYQKTFRFVPRAHKRSPGRPQRSGDIRAHVKCKTVYKTTKMTCTQTITWTAATVLGHSCDMHQRCECVGGGWRRW